MQINVEHLLVFVTVTEKGTFSAAARSLGKTQGAIRQTTTYSE
ncbi:LysR family transcriptional regulator [Vibrio methylphosphonaticus]|nr:LysR family transcriptional regulator [Vibrio methylphosphonaticus]MCL9774014.1 LysR family transcriptional regulator [Vibrio methylphosphonaticus]